MALRYSIRLLVALLLLSLAPLARAAPPEKPMRLQDALLPVFVGGGPEVAPGPALDAWLAARPDAQLLLPFTIWRGSLGEVTHAALGAHETPPSATVRLEDAALGVSLADRLRGLCGPEARCLVWLSGLWRPGGFELRAVHERLEGDGPWFARVARKPECLVVRVQKALHCARGPERCERCREAASGPALPKLLDLCPEGDVARPVVTLERNGREEHRVYDVLRSFATLEEAKLFAKAHGIEVVAAEP